MKLVNFKTKKEYIVNGPVYENPDIGVWCGTASDSELGDCFVKIFNYSVFDNPKKQRELLNMAQSEAQTIAFTSSCSDKVPKLYDSWHDKHQSRYIIVMQKIPGVTLRQWMKKHPIKEVTDKDLFVRAMIIRQIALILQSINLKRPTAVHRDLKPENIMINLNEKKWEVYLIDFGCTHLDYVRNVGTALYQAPEQSKKQSLLITPKTDVYTLGIILYELLTGTVPRLGHEFVPSRTQPVWAKTPSLPESITAFDKGKNLEYLFHSMTEFDASRRLDYSRITRLLNYKKGHR